MNKCEVYRYISTPARTSPLYIENSIDEHEEYEYRLPAAYRGFKVNRESTIDDTFGLVKIRVTKEPATRCLKVRKDLRINGRTISVAEYPGFMEFCLKLESNRNFRSWSYGRTIK